MSPNFLPWIILFLPLGSAAVIGLFTLRQRSLSAGISISAVVIAFILSVIFVSWAGLQPADAESIATWLNVGDLHVDFGLRFDPLSLMMLQLVTGVASVIHIYSWGYMSEDRSFPRFYAFLSLFTFPMLGIVLSNNFLQMFIFWELVGLSSYLLVSFWFEKPAAADAGKKAFLTNRIGDYGFLLGIILVWAVLGSLHFGDAQHKLEENPQIFGALATTAGLLIFCGAMGKSAQFPLHVWLPDAMEGPTPVSALIHAATMVAAGVYMLCRVFFLFEIPGSHAPDVIAWIGGITAAMAAFIAIQQDDIKRILAYSTLSQLGYMVMSVGVGGPSQAMYHLTTHAFFKALLFLGAGSVIVGMHHEQDIWKMGGLKHKMPTTFWTFMVGTLALSGLPPFSGFYSKDSILGQAAQHHFVLFLIGVAVAALTPFYMMRLVCVAFFGRPRGEGAEHAHESPPVMTWPLRILAVPAAIAGWLGIEQLYARQFPAEHIAPAGSFLQRLAGPFMESPAAAAGGLVAVLIGLSAGWMIYSKAATDPLPEKLGALSRWLRNRLYFDELYEATVIRLHDFIAAVADFIDRWIIGGLGVRGLQGTTELVGRALRMVQTGSLQTYAFLFALGVAFVLYFALR